MSSGFDIALAPATISAFWTYQSAFKNSGILIEHSDFIGMSESNNIASKISHDAFSIFNYHKCFSNLVWSFILLFMIITAVISAILDKDNFCSSIMRFLWNYFITLFWAPIEPMLCKRGPKLLMSFWLISALIISIHFTAYLLDYMAKLSGHRTAPIFLQLKIFGKS